MARKVTLFTGQWADLPFATVAERASEMGYDGLELSCWGDFIDVEKGAKSKAYCEDRLAKLNEYGLGCWAISNHLSGQLVCDELDERHNPFAPEKIRAITRRCGNGRSICRRRPPRPPRTSASA